MFEEELEPPLASCHLYNVFALDKIKESSNIDDLNEILEEQNSRKPLHKKCLFGQCLSRFPCCVLLALS